MKLGRTPIAVAAAVVMLLISADGAEPTNPVHAQTTSDRDALVALYNATDGPNWTYPNWIRNHNWLSDKPLDEWYGVTADARDHVIVLRRWSSQLNGELPAELGNLSSIRELNLSRNQLSGE